MKIFLLFDLLIDLCVCNIVAVISHNWSYSGISSETVIRIKIKYPIFKVMVNDLLSFVWNWNVDKKWSIGLNWTFAIDLFECGIFPNSPNVTAALSVRMSNGPRINTGQTVNTATHAQRTPKPLKTTANRQPNHIIWFEWFFIWLAGWCTVSVNAVRLANALLLALWKVLETINKSPFNLANKSQS